MSVTVRHLNADSTFLLTFSPSTTPTSFDLLSAHGAFSVLIDPWLIGSSIVNAKWFAVTQRVVPSAINHLSEIEEPDVVLVSQNKPDHCHKETLLQLKPEGKTLIAAEPGAAKTIKSWDHFDPNRVHALTKYDAKARFGNTLRLRIPPLGPDGLPGELNIAFIPARNYMTGLHNAFGITYQAPTRVRTLASVTTIDLPKKNFSMPFTTASQPAQDSHLLSPVSVPFPPSNVATQADDFSTRPKQASDIPGIDHTPWQQLSRSSEITPSEFLTAGSKPRIHPSQERLWKIRTDYSGTSGNNPEVAAQNGSSDDTVDFTDTSSTPPRSSLSPSPTQSPRLSDVSDTSAIPQSATTFSSFSASFPHSPSLAELQARYSRLPTVRPARPKAISALYSPHGLPLADLQPYIQNHLVPLPGALPLTCLFHSFDYAKNPWWFGGNIMMGVEGGMEIARALMAKCWISAHDEEKDDKGLAVKLLKCDRNDEAMVKSKLAAVDSAWDCDVRALDVGAEVLLSTASHRKQSTSSSSDGGLGIEVAEFRFHDAG